MDGSIVSKIQTVIHARSGQSAGEEGHRIATISELQAGFDLLLSRIDGGTPSRRDLLQLVPTIEALTRDFEKMTRRMQSVCSSSRAAVASQAALQELWDWLYMVEPHHRYVWPEQLRRKLQHALASVDRAIIAMRWSGLEEKAS